MTAVRGPVTGPVLGDPAPGDPTLGAKVLDNPVWASLTGRHAHLAERHGLAARYQPDVAPFVALQDATDPRAWTDLADLLGPGATIVVTSPVLDVPAGWQAVERGEGVQLVDTHVEAGPPDADVVRLTAADVPELLDLTARTAPGPFLPRTVELGTYLGIRREGRLVAMAGERLQPPGWVEISAVCTDPAHRGQGLASRLVRAVVHGIRERGEHPFMHAAATNTNAIRLYEALGFTLRRRTTFAAVRTPDA